MKTLPPDLARHVPADRVQNLYIIRDRRNALLDEAEKCARATQLAAWRSEAKALVGFLTTQLEDDEVKITAFEASLAPLEDAIDEEKKATAQFSAAKAAHFAGSLKRTEALKLRDDVEVTAQMVKIKTRARENAADKVRAGLPMSPNLTEGGCKDIVDGLASVCLNRRFRPENVGTIDHATWQRWLELADVDLMWLPLHAARKLAEAKQELKKHDSTHPDGSTFVDYRREPVVLPVDEFVEELSKFKASRAAHLRSKLEKAAQELEMAKERVAALTGGAE